ncbi:Cancer-related nucleoside-triphosphatase [Merluccius polli]|uniref:Cancer-related nucleoside-triphosphatase n=1 Tax=Merluccius polli TaxID=89951 RepID=A0AA47MUN0_MERPO|nr:Cancer-related nucleoside-triphosphatase [Merluccius polli]
MFKHVFLTGPPGVGKTTLVRGASDALVSSGAAVGGFHTEEVREGGRRVGFDVGRRRCVSRETGAHGWPTGSLAEGGGKKVFVIDEIGKMELFSQPFIRAVRQTLDSPCCSILGTIPISRGKPLALVEEVRSRSDVKVFTVSKDNRNVILQDIISALQECLTHTS